MLRIRQVVEKDENEQHVRPPEGALRGERRAGCRTLKWSGKRASNELLRPDRFGLDDRQERVREQECDHQTTDQAQNDVRVHVLDLVALEAFRMDDETAVEGKRDGHEHKNG